MSARTEFLAELGHLRSGADLELLHDGTVEGRIREHLAAGLAVRIFITVEQFIRARGAELSTFISGGTGQFSNLTTERQISLLKRSLEAMLAETKHGDPTDTSLVIDGARQLGTALKDFGSGGLSLSKTALLWSGSNPAVADVEGILQILGSTKPWESMTAILKRVRHPDANTLTVKSQFDQLMSTRHRAAHRPSADVSVVLLRSLPRSALFFVLAFDLLGSRLALELRDGRKLAAPGEVHRLVELRFVEPIAAKWRSIGENRLQGARFDDRPSAVAHAVAAMTRGCVVERDRLGEPLDWHFGFGI